MIAAGALLPIALARTKRMHVPPVAFFIAKYFGSGVIIATAFIHVSNTSSGVYGYTISNISLSAWTNTDAKQLMAPATEALQSPCLTGPIMDYSWAEGIALMTVFTMFFIELMASRFDVFGTHEHEAADPAKNLLRDTEKYGSDSTLKKRKHFSIYSWFEILMIYHHGFCQLTFYYVKCISVLTILYSECCRS